MAEKTFVVEKTCPICEETTRVVKTRSRLAVVKRDEDGCVHYEDFNPYFYTIWTCEHCGFAADEKTFTTKMPDRHVKILRNELLKNKFGVDFVEERTFKNAAFAFKLAISYLESVEGKFSKMAKYAHQLAWVYREAGDEDNEKIFLQDAANFYDSALAKENFPVDGLTDSAAIYIIGAIYWRLGEYEKCATYLSRLMKDDGLRSRDPKLFDKVRDLWGDVRGALRDAKK
ncbi:MAG: DUF2225 domain-containing protein [Selenomonadaceae bacterium]|nr:DUF2225 domain-containing protein [Selenomonadaceae bacterium]MBR4384798.1 DUF2225 domain-containing protein [Selenomonadaceae bacterium]